MALDGFKFSLTKLNSNEEVSGAAMKCLESLGKCHYLHSSNAELEVTPKLKLY